MMRICFLLLGIPSFFAWCVAFTDDAVEGNVAQEPHSVSSDAEIAIADAAFLKSFADPFLADGFDFPAGDGRKQGKSRDVFTIGNGRVIYAQDGIVVIEHHFLENGKLGSVFSRYGQLKELLVTKEQSVRRRTKIGTIAKGSGAQLQFEVRRANPDASVPSAEQWTEEQIAAHYKAAVLFIKARRRLTHPATTPELLLAVKHRYQLHRFRNGAITKTYEIALSQNPVGHKLTEGDLRMPEGEYRIIQKAMGPFSGPSWMNYLGAAWLRIDYPNNSDAAAAMSEKRITQPVHDAIERAHRTGKMPPQDSALGGGIGVHGWKSPGWNPAGDRRITWGCISLNEADLLKLTAETKLGTPIIIVP